MIYDDAKVHAAKIAMAMNADARRAAAQSVSASLEAVRKHAPELNDTTAEHVAAALYRLTLSAPSEGLDFAKAELAFIARMVPHIEAGKSFDEAAQAVLDDDQRLYEKLHGPERTYIVDALCQHVYHAARGAR